MSSYHDSTDLSTLIGPLIPTDYLHQERERELVAASAEDFDGYDDWSEEVEDAFPENFVVRDGKVFYRQEPPKSNGRIDGIEW
jgi:hypothetical protein